MSERAANLILAKLKKYSVEVGVEAINRSISSGWRDVFPEKANIQSRKSKPFGKPSRLGSALEYYSDNLEEIRATKAIDSDIIDAEIVS